MGKTKNIVHDPDRMQEGKIENFEYPEIKMSDEDLVSIANSWIAESRPLHDGVLKKQQLNERYYLGDQIDKNRLEPYQAQIVLNKIFQSLETVIPRATKNIPAPSVALPLEEDESKEIDNRVYSDNLESILYSVATDQGISQKLKDFLRFSQLYYLGVLKFGYDEDTKNIWIENLRPQRIMVPPRDKIDYVIEYHEDSVKDLIVKFKNKKREILESVCGNPDTKSKKMMGSIVGYYEITTAEFKFWKLHGIILEKISNPHYNFKDKKKNHWIEPEMDYIFSDIWTLKMNPYSQTTLVDQVITVQDAINKRKRQISDNADHANGLTVAYGTMGVTKRDAADIESARKKPNSVAYIKEGASGAVQNFNGQMLQPFVAEDMAHSIAEIDNIFGTHSVTRGEKQPGEETFSGRMLLKEGDQERIDELTQMLERVMEKMYNAIAQLIKRHFDKVDFVAYLGEDGTSKQLKIDKDLIKEGVKIKVRQGSTITKDKVGLGAEAIQLWDRKAIDPITLMERIGDPHPYKTAERLYLWMQAPDKLFKQAAITLDQATKSDNAEQVMLNVAQAEMENRILYGGQPVPPFEKANAQHLAAHQDFWSGPEIEGLDPQIKALAANHIEAESKIVQEGLIARKEKESSKNIKEQLDTRSQ